MTDLPPWVSYVNDETGKVRKDLNDRMDKLGGEVADERKSREISDKDLADDITAITSGRLANLSARVWAFVITGVTLVGGGLITLAVFLIEASSHLSGGKP